MTVVIYCMIDYFIILVRKLRHSFITFKLFLSLKKIVFCLLKFIRIENIKYCVEHKIAPLENCFSCKLSCRLFNIFS